MPMGIPFSRGKRTKTCGYLVRQRGSEGKGTGVMEAVAQTALFTTGCSGRTSQRQHLSRDLKKVWNWVMGRGGRWWRLSGWCMTGAACWTDSKRPVWLAGVSAALCLGTPWKPPAEAVPRKRTGMAPPGVQHTAGCRIQQEHTEGTLEQEERPHLPQFPS